MTSVDTVLDLLKRTQRRYALYELDGRENPVRLEELAEEVARMDANGSEITAEQVARCEMTLHHDHLPRAARTEFIEYDPDDGVARMADAPPEFETLLTVAETLERPL
jgi:hypothetical protein